MITKERLLEILDKSKPEDKVSFYTEIALSSLINESHSCFIGVGAQFE